MKKLMAFLLAFLLCAGITSPTPAAAQPSPWAADQVNQAIAEGLVPRSLQSEYTRAVTRAEFCALAVELYEKVTQRAITERMAFLDTIDVNIQKMGALGVVSGEGDGIFNPDGALTREQAATILARLAAAIGSPLHGGPAGFADSDKIASWALTGVGRVASAGIMTGEGGNMFSPQGPYTREQSILTIMRLYEYERDGGTPPDSGSFVLAEQINVILDNTNIAAIDPFNWATNNSSSNMAFTMVYDRLVERDPDTGQYIPRLAVSWETEDFKTFTFRLRDDVYFHNGDKLTSADVLWTTLIGGSSGPGSAAWAAWGNISSISAPDAHTITLSLGRVNVDYLFNLSMPGAGIVSQRAMEKDPENGTQIGTGAYMVEDFSRHDFVRFVRNGNYWDRLAETRHVTFRFVPEMSNRYIMMLSQESHISFGIPEWDMPLFQHDPENFTVRTLTFNDPQGLSFNLDDPITGDYHFRMAVMHAMDKTEIASAASGVWARADYDSGTVWGLNTEFRNDGIPAIPHDPGEARRHLALSGYNGESVEIAAGIPTNIRAAYALQSQLEELGINATVYELDSPSLIAYTMDRDSGSQMAFFPIRMDESSGSYRNMFSPEGSQNRMNYNNPLITRMLEEASLMIDVNRRREHYMRMQEIIAEDAPFVNVFWRSYGVVAASGIGGVTIPSDNRLVDLRWIYMIQD